VKKLILFVHGLGGSEETWGKFPELIKNDKGFCDTYAIKQFTYKTSLWRIKSASSISSKIISIIFPQSISSKISALFSVTVPQSKLPKIQHIANLLKTDIEEYYSEYDEIFLITHSMGGLVARKYLHNMIKSNSKLQVKKLMLYAVPNNGSKWAKLVALYAHEQIEQLNEESDFLEDLNEEMSDINLDKYLEVQYMIGYEDEVVSASSAKSYHQNKNVKYLPNGHIDIVKPLNEEDRPYRFFRNFILGKENNFLKEDKKIIADDYEDIKENPFIRNIHLNLESKKLVTLFSQDFTEISLQQEQVKQKMQYLFKKNFYHIRIPKIQNNESKYFEFLAKDCDIDTTIDSIDKWSRAVSTKLTQKRNQKICFYITDIEDGDEKLNLEFARVIRSLQSEFTNFYAIFVGRKTLASLVYGKSSKLSPLNTSVKIFFDNHTESINENDIRQELEKLKNEDICIYLDDDVKVSWIYYSTSVLNILFWRNIMLNNNGFYKWRNEETKQIVKEVFGC